MIERTLVLLKPDAVQRGLVGEILSRFEKPGFKIIGMNMVYADKDIAGKHYADDEKWLKAVGDNTRKSLAAKGQDKGLEANDIDIGRRVRSWLMEFISMSPIVALCIEGHGAIDKIRQIVGDTQPHKAMPGTIRGDFALDSYAMADDATRPIQNLIHASDSKETAEREIAVWFKPNELYPYQRVDESLIYRKVNRKGK
jgi:nucleoside-diphosphate kinase